MLTKREFLKTAAAIGGSLLTSSLANSQETKNEEQVQLNDTTFSWVRGFNYQPGYSNTLGGYSDSSAGTGINLWRPLRLDVIKQQLTRAVELYPKTTALRIWLPYNVWLLQPKQFEEDFSAYIKIIADLKLRVMPILFNAWHGSPDFGAFPHKTFPTLPKEELQKTFEYATALFKREGDNPAIYAWDMCNEPEQNPQFPDFCKWLQELYTHIKTTWSKSVLTVGVLDEKTLYKVNAFSDVLGPRMYMIPGSDYKGDVQKYQAWINRQVKVANELKKPMINTETGWPRGDDGKKRAEEGLRNELGINNAAKIGWMIHALWESPVADLHRSSDGPRGVGWMSCINKDGTIRDGHEIINEYL